MPKNIKKYRDTIKVLKVLKNDKHMMVHRENKIVMSQNKKLEIISHRGV
jgi:hypothetical protein